jgi:hypothetical protein
VLREAVAARPFLDLLTADRADLQKHVLHELDRRCREYGEDGLGIELDGLSLHDLHPPQDVVDAYHNVTRAMQKRDEEINKARADATQIEGKAQAEALEMVAAAEAEKHAIIEKSKAEMAAVRARYRARTQLTWREEVRLLMESVLVALNDHTGGQAVRAYHQRRREEMLAGLAELTDFRIAWEALAAALARRDKVLIDSDKMKGRITLFDADVLRALTPVIVPRANMPARRQRNTNEEEP